MKRLPFLDWTRGLAVVIMIQCHTFNCYTDRALRDSGPYVLTQFIGGMAAVLFLFLAGITFSFQMDRLDARGTPARERLNTLLRRAGYILVIAYLFRLSNSLFSMPTPGWKVLLKVDILNCMGVGMAALSVLGLWRPQRRPHAAAIVGLAIASAAPLLSAADWSGVPVPVRDYLVPNPKMFPLFPWSAYLAFGIAAGTILRRLPQDRLERTMQWAVLAGFGLIFGAQYFSNIPYSLYHNAQFWVDSPALIIIRVGICLVTLAIAYLWTMYVAAPGWSWVGTLGKTSLMAYWVHVMVVYGWIFEAWKGRLTLAQTALMTVAITAAMVALGEARLRWRERRAVRVAAAGAFR